MLQAREYLEAKRRLVDSFLDSYRELRIKPARLKEAMDYSLLAGGKRIRPVLCLAAYEACGGNPEEIVAQASAIEFIHAYSLIHDDLPALDNDALRRGQPTNHIVFGEAMAILAGDALLTDAFRVFSDCESIPPDRVLTALRDLASAAGVMGMVAGQAQDILAESGEPDADTIRFIHMFKTGALIRSAVRIGALLAGAPTPDLDLLTVYGNNVGLAFQIIDDILDIEGTTEELGKPRGSDAAKKKMTYPLVFGIERSRETARELAEGAIESVSRIEGDSLPLIAIARYLLARTH